MGGGLDLFIIQQKKKKVVGRQKKNGDRNDDGVKTLLDKDGGWG